jgi:hypothetical protein
MRKILKPAAIVLLAVFIIIQFFHPKKNIAASNAVFANDISNIYTVPQNIRQILETSCNDCHSNNTKYPWYSNVQPIAWWLDDHIKEGKRELNFSEFATFPIRRKFKKMEEIIEQVREDEMPLFSYTMIHRDASLSNEQKVQLTSWATAIRDTIKATYPPDSLRKKG